MEGGMTPKDQPSHRTQDLKSIVAIKLEFSRSK